MKITSILQQKKDKEKYSIFIDGQFRFSAEAIDVIRLGLKTDVELDEIKLMELMEECEASRAFQYLLNLVSKRSYTTMELQKRLSTRQFGAETIEHALKKLSELGLLNDQDYAERFIQDGLSLKKHGRNKIIYDLKLKGISVKELPDVELDAEVELTNACQLAAKKFQSLSNKPNAKEKLYRYLVGRGYDYETAKRAVQRAMDQSMEDEFIEF